MKKKAAPASVDDGWSQAGLKIATMLSSRPEVTSKGIVGAVGDILAALDKKPKKHSLKYHELAAKLKESENQSQFNEEQAKKHRLRRNQLVGQCLNICEDETINSKIAVRRILQLVKQGLSERVLEQCRQQANSSTIL
jgi:hypothetical protein